MKTLWILTVAFFIMAGTASAQGFSEKIEEGLENIRSRKMSKIETLIKLDEDEMETFRDLYDEYQEALQDEDERYIMIAWQYLDQSRKLTDDSARKLVREYLELEESRARLKRDYMEQFGEILPPVQLVHLFQLENKADALFKHDLATHIPMLE